MRSKGIILTGLLIAVLAVAFSAGISCELGIASVVDIEVSIVRISNGQGMELNAGKLDRLAFTDFEFIVDSNSGVKTGEDKNAVIFYRADLKVWLNTTIKVYAQEGTIEDLAEDFFFPEDDPGNQVAVEIEVLDGERFRVSPASGSFPPRSQVVLELDFGGGAGYTKRVLTE